MKKTLLVMGGDKRMEYCAERLSEAFDVYTYGFSNSKPIWELNQADILVLPYFSLSGEYLNTPSLSHKIPAVSALDMLRYGGTLFGGGLSSYPGFLSYCSERNAVVFDFFSDEDLTCKNAWLTAEGAAELILKNTDISLKDSDILILGFGRVGRACAKLLGGMGAKIHIAARSESARKDAGNLDFDAAPFTDAEALKVADTVINTVPSAVLGRSELSLLKKDAYILDLASKPYGVDFAAAEEMNLHAETAPGLPGKSAPKTAGYFIAESIIKSVEGGKELG